MSIEKRFFGKLDGKGDVDIYKITNKNGAFVELMTLGAGIHSINVPDRNGKLGDVVLGFDDVNNYLNPDLGYQGLVVGRYANRIRDAKFSMDGVEYNTPKNQGTWTLHGGGRFSFNIWEVKETGNDFVVFSFFSPDMQDGFPGNFTMNVKYTFDDSNTLKIEYFVLSDKKTVANPTNHAYFNLSADSSKTVEDEYLQVNADKFLKRLNCKWIGPKNNLHPAVFRYIVNRFNHFKMSLVKMHCCTCKKSVFNNINIIGKINSYINTFKKLVIFFFNKLYKVTSFFSDCASPKHFLLFIIIKPCAV